MLISCAVTVQLIWAFVFTYAKSRFPYDAAHFSCRVLLTIVMILPVLLPEDLGLVVQSIVGGYIIKYTVFIVGKDSHTFPTKMFAILSLKCLRSMNYCRHKF